jgi:hypothetical protein
LLFDEVMQTASGDWKIDLERATGIESAASSLASSGLLVATIRVRRQVLMKRVLFH